MSQQADSNPRDRRVSCPECGAQVRPRGLAGHRRLKHGAVAVHRRRTSDPELAGVREALTAITGALDRLDRRLVNLEVDPAKTEDGGELDALREELDAVVDQITLVKATFGGPETETDEEQRERLRTELGRLRRRQAVLLFRLGTEAPGADPEDAEAGWGLF